MPTGSTINASIVDAQLLRGTAGTTAATVVPTVRDVTLKVTPGEAKANNRASRWEQSLPTLLAAELEFEFLSDASDTHLAAFIAAAVGCTPIALYIKDKSTNQGLDADWGIFGMDDSQKLEDNVLIKFTAKPWAGSGRYPQWH